jgi:hypothetical protein
MALFINIIIKSNNRKNYNKRNKSYEINRDLVKCLNIYLILLSNQTIDSNL